jgi:RNA-directed DNA polymerase
MLFSSEDEKKLDEFFVKMISNILKSKGFLLNRKKIKRGISEISLNGFVVGENIRISRKKRSDINQFIFEYEKNGVSKNINVLINRLNNCNFYYRIVRFQV